MPVRGELEFKALSLFMEDLAKAGQDIDSAVETLLRDEEPYVENELRDNLKRTSEQWTGETANSIQISGVQRDGNYIFWKPLRAAVKPRVQSTKSLVIHAKRQNHLCALRFAVIC